MKRCQPGPAISGGVFDGRMGCQRARQSAGSSARIRTAGFGDSFRRTVRDFDQDEYLVPTVAVVAIVERHAETAGFSVVIGARPAQREAARPQALPVHPEQHEPAEGAFRSLPAVP